MGQDDTAAALIEAEKELAELLEQQRDAERAAMEEAAGRVQYLGSILQKKADERSALRSEIEQRWLKAIRQINGIYEAKELPKKQDDKAYGSEVYVPLTRRLRNLVEARLVDVLFPSDNRSWVLSPSPRSEMDELKGALAGVDPNTPLPAGNGETVADLQKSVEDVQKEAEIKSSRMQRQVDDRLAEGRWPAVARRAIGEAIDLGTGVVKGPVPFAKRTKIWMPDANGGALALKEEVVPRIEFVSVWNWYPDLSATDIEDCVDFLESHPMTRQELAALRGQPGFNPAAIDMALKGAPRPDNQSRRSDLRDLAGLSAAPDERYIVWEFNGPLQGKDLNACMRCTPTGEGEEYVDEYDDDEDYQSVVWFVDGIVIKAIVRPLDPDAGPIYSCFWWQRDRASIFGYGLPDEARDQQASANGSFRAMLDNMGLCVGPQIVIDDDAVQPMDGRNELRPLKFWRKTNPSIPAQAALAAINIESRITELSAIFDKSKMLIDEIATVPGFVAGSEQPQYLQSATGASIAYNSATLWVRRFVRQWDDMIEPLMGRMVRWELDHNPDQSIKGDYHPIAKGVSALVELEGLGPRMLQFVQTISGMGLSIRDKYRAARKLASSLKLDPDEVLPSEEETQQMSAQPSEGLEDRKVRVMEQNNQMDHEAKMAELTVKDKEIAMRAEEYARREKLALLELASRERMTLEQAAQKYGYDLRKLEGEMVSAERQRQHEAQMQNAETALKLSTGSGL